MIGRLGVAIASGRAVFVDELADVTRDDLTFGRDAEARSGEDGTLPRVDEVDDAVKFDDFVDSRSVEFEGAFLGVLLEVGTLDILFDNSVLSEPPSRNCCK